VTCCFQKCTPSQYLLRVSDKNHTDTNRFKDWLEPNGETGQELAEESQCVATLQLGPVLLSIGKSDFSA